MGDSPVGTPPPISPPISVPESGPDTPTGSASMPGGPDSPASSSVTHSSPPPVFYSGPEEVSTTLSIPRLLPPLVLHQKITIKYGEYNGQVANGIPHGQGVLTCKNGDIYEGKWRNGNIVSGTATYKNGPKYEGGFKNLKRYGMGVMTYKNGVTVSGEFQTGPLNGLMELKYPNGCQIRCHYIDNHPKEIILTPQFAQWLLDHLQKGSAAGDTGLPSWVGPAVLEALLPYAGLPDELANIFQECFKNTDHIAKVNPNELVNSIQPNTPFHLLFGSDAHAIVVTLIKRDMEYDVILSDKSYSQVVKVGEKWVLNPHTAVIVDERDIIDVIRFLQEKNNQPDREVFGPNCRRQYLVDQFERGWWQPNQNSPFNRHVRPQKDESCWLHSYQVAVALNLMIRLGNSPIGDSEWRDWAAPRVRAQVLLQLSSANPANAATRAQVMKMPTWKFVYKLGFPATSTLVTCLENYLATQSGSADLPGMVPPSRPFG